MFIFYLYFICYNFPGDNMLKIILKYWKVYLIFLMIVFGIYFTKRYIEEKTNSNEPNKLLFTVNDDSKKCYSNTLYVYNNGKYEIVGINYNNDEPNIIKTGNYNYNIEKVMNMFDDKTCDNENYLNYRITIDENTSYCIGINSTHELNKFIESLNEENLFWCS